ncbi:MAG: L,D-transpeptidase [Anaerolineales bacterium]
MSISRREFLKLSSASALTLAAFRLPGLAGQAAGLTGRVSYDSVSVFDRPRLNAITLGYRFRDELLNVNYSLSPLTGPAYNPLWYRLADGYVHAGLIQPVAVDYNQPVSTLPDHGRLFRVTIPSTQPYNFFRQTGWMAEGRFLLYFHSNHWVTDIVDGPDGEPWYEITESWEGVQYYAKATHLAPIPDEDFSPISTQVPDSEKRIEISLTLQSLTAFEGEQIVFRTSISSGVRNTGAAGLPTETPKGSFNIMSKLPAKYMGDNRLTDTLGDKYLPGVPWTAFFAEGGYAIHGAYWHNNFGAPMSRGCVNMRPSEAQWLYRWVTPVAGPNEWEARGQGTRVIVS